MACGGPPTGRESVYITDELSTPEGGVPAALARRVPQLTRYRNLSWLPKERVTLSTSGSSSVSVHQMAALSQYLR